MTLEGVYDLGRHIRLWEVYMTLVEVCDLAGPHSFSQGLLGIPRKTVDFVYSIAIPSPQIPVTFSTAALSGTPGTILILLTFHSNSLKTAASEPTQKSLYDQDRDSTALSPRSPCLCSAVCPAFFWTDSLSLNLRLKPYVKIS